MLYRVLREIEEADGPLSLAELSRRLDVAPDVVRELIAFWVRKGRLGESGGETAVPPTCATHRCSPACTDPTTCLFTAKMPKTYTLTHRQANRGGDMPSMGRR